MTVREWFRILRMEEWQRDAGRVMDIRDMLTPAGLYDDKDYAPMPELPENTFMFWRRWQPVADGERRARIFARLAGIELAPTPRDRKIQLVQDFMNKALEEHGRC